MACSRSHKIDRGFTLVEMLVVAPIVVLAIGAFLTAIISMTGEVIASRASNALSYNVQDALNRIEQDVKMSSSFLATNNVPITAGNAQGYNNDNTYFTNIAGASGTSIILNMVATTGNPISTSSSYVYVKDKPNPCASAQGNTPFTYNVVYFVKTDTSGTSTLWRRTIMPTNYTDTTNTVCAVPFQQPSCLPSYMETTTPAFCKTSDIKLVSGVNPADFIVSYYNGEGSTTASIPASSGTTPTRNIALQSATTVSVTINAKQSAGGRDVAHSALLRVSRLDTNASSIGITTVDGTPAAPVISAAGSVPTNVTFSWSKVPGATGYTIEYQKNGGAWTTGFTNQNTTSYPITGLTHNDVVNARVTAINSVGTSGYGTTTYTVPLWAPLTVQNGWVNYSPPFSSAAYTKTSAGLIVLKGMVKAGSGTIAQLPAGYRPAAQIMFENSTNQTGGRLDIDVNGNIGMAVGSNAWFSLDGVSFMPAGATFTGATFANGWVNYGGSWTNPGYMTDSLGRVQIGGLTKNGTTTSPTPMFTLPVGSRPAEYAHVVNDIDNGGAHFGVDSAGNVSSKGYGNGYLSLQYMFYPSGRATGATCTTQWCNMSLQNSWAFYGAPYGVPQYTKSADGMVLLKGLVNNGTSAGATITNLPAGYCPAEQLLFATVSSINWSRLDVIRQANGSCDVVPSAGSTVWFSLDDIRYMAE